MNVRTINGVYDEIKAADPNTAITRCAIRQAVVSGAIPSKKAGRKYLVNIEAVKRYFGAIQS